MSEIWETQPITTQRPENTNVNLSRLFLYYCMSLVKTYSFNGLWTSRVVSLIPPGLTKTQFAVDSHRSFVIQSKKHLASTALQQREHMTVSRELPFQSTYISHTN